MTILKSVGEQLCYNIVTELNKEKNQEQLQKNILEPMLKYFINHLDGTPVTIADGKNGLEVLSILEKATSSLINKKEKKLFSEINHMTN